MSNLKKRLPFFTTDKSSQHEASDKPERMHWSSRKGFLCAVIGLTVGLGDSFLFPNMLCTNGGGAFLIPYTLVVVTLGIPITLMELGLGQFSSRGPLDVWILCPLGQGMGVGLAVYCFVMASYYNVLITYCLYYFICSFASPLPWESCDPKWALENCMTRFYNTTVYLSCIHEKGESYCKNVNWQLVYEHFFVVHVLGETENDIADGLGSIKWDLALCLFICSLLTFIILSKGLLLVEKVSKYLIFYPYMCMVILLFISLISEGSGRSLKALLVPKFDKLRDISVWITAFQLAFYSLGLCCGVLITFGSYCPFRSPCNMDAIILNVIDYGSSFMFGLVTFNCMATISYKLDIDMQDILNSKKSVLFVIMPEALTYLTGPSPLWSIIFYSMTFTVGLNAQYCLIASNLGIIYDKFPQSMRYKIHVNAVYNLIVYLSGLIFVTNNGSVLLDILDDFMAGPIKTCTTLLQTILVSWLYGMKRFADDLHFMLGFRPSAYWQGCWLLSPVITFLVHIYEFMHWNIISSILTILFGWMFWGIIMTSFLAYAIVNFVRFKRRKKWYLVMRPLDYWGPPDPVLLKSRRLFCSKAMTKEYMYRQTKFGGKTHTELTQENYISETTDYDFINPGTSDTLVNESLAKFFEEDQTPTPLNMEIAGDLIQNDYPVQVSDDIRPTESSRQFPDSEDPSRVFSKEESSTVPAFSISTELSNITNPIESSAYTKTPKHASKASSQNISNELSFNKHPSNISGSNVSSKIYGSTARLKLPSVDSPVKLPSYTKSPQRISKVSFRKPSDDLFSKTRLSKISDNNNPTEVYGNKTAPKRSVSSNKYPTEMPSNNQSTNNSNNGYSNHVSGYPQTSKDSDDNTTNLPHQS